MNRFIKFQNLKPNIGLISLNNVKDKNALNFDLLNELETTINTNKKTNKVLIINSLCPKVFSAGHYLKEIYRNLNNKNELEIIMNKLSGIIKQMTDINKTNFFIAEIDGLATAAGLELAAACDIVVATKLSNFAIPGSNIGLYAATPAQILLKNLPPKICFDMLVTGRRFSAKEMFDFGLVNDLADNSEQLRALAIEISDKILINTKI